MIEHWQDVEDRWPGRNRAIARLIPKGVSVLDLGAGAQGLREFLPGRSYTPADIFPRTKDTLPFDMNAGTWPAGRWDVAVMSGVLEYADDPRDALAHLRRLSTWALVSYVHSRNPNQPLVFANELSEDDFRSLVWDVGWRKAIRSSTWKTKAQKRHVIWRLV